MMTDDCRTFGEDFFQQLSERKSTQMTEHLLTDKMIEDNLPNRFWWELETCQLEPCQNALREAYDKGREEGRKERLIEVLHWLRATRYYGRVTELADQLEEAMLPQGDNND